MASSRSQSHPRRIRRFFCRNKLTDVDQVIQLSSSETNHLQNVLRLNEGELCLLADGTGQVASAVILKLQEGGLAQLKVKELLSSEGMDSSLRIHIHLAMPQKGKFEYLVEKAQELALDQLTPIETRRTVVKIEKSQVDKVCKRWERIIQSAAKQSGSTRFLEIFPPQKFQKAVECIPRDEKIVLFHPDDDAISFSEWLRELEGEHDSGQKLHLFFGPEGGFTKEEVEVLMQRDCKKVGLGRAILKVDSAFLSVLGALRLIYEG